MKTYLVTGGAGFIGANYIKFLLHEKYKDEAIKVVVLDALTYAGNLGTIKDDIDNERCLFVKGDIRDRALVDPYRAGRAGKRKICDDRAVVKDKRAVVQRNEIL